MLTGFKNFILRGNVIDLVAPLNKLAERNSP